MDIIVNCDVICSNGLFVIGENNVVHLSFEKFGELNNELIEGEWSYSD